MQNKKMIDVAVAILIKDSFTSSPKVWLQRRQEQGPLNGLWEFPGGKIKVGESAVETAKREFKEECLQSLDSLKGFELGDYHHEYEDRCVSLRFVGFYLKDQQGWGPSFGQWVDLWEEKGQINPELTENMLQGNQKFLNDLSNQFLELHSLTQTQKEKMKCLV